MEKVYVIPDRTINSLLRRLAYEKGDNIVCLNLCLVYTVKPFLRLSSLTAVIPAA